jgi:hypothetical protein
MSDSDANAEPDPQDPDEDQEAEWAPDLTRALEPDTLPNRPLTAASVSALIPKEIG